MSNAIHFMTAWSGCSCCIGGARFLIRAHRGWRGVVLGAVFLATLVGCGVGGGCQNDPAALGSFSTWSMTYGGSLTDVARAILQTSDGGFVFVGTTESFGAGGKDIWVTRQDPGGGVIWSKAYGSGGFALLEVFDMVLTGDGGSVVVGSVADARGGTDVGIARLDAAGVVLWQRSFGGDGLEIGYSVARDAGGYVVAGFQETNDRRLDGLVLRFGENGALVWDRRHGGTGDDQLRAIVKNPDDPGFVAVGWKSKDDGRSDGWVLKLNANGGIEIEQTVPSSVEGESAAFFDVRATRGFADLDADGEPDVFMDINNDGAPDRGFLAVGIIGTLEGDDRHEFLYRMGPNLEQIERWRRDNPNTTPAAVGEQDNLAMIYVGTRRVDGVNHGYVGKINPNTGVSYSGIVDPGTEQTIFALIRDRRLGDGSFIIGGYRYNAAGDVNEAFIAPMVLGIDQLDATAIGAAETFRPLLVDPSRERLPSHHSVRSIVPMDDGGYLVGGHSFNLDEPAAQNAGLEFTARGGWVLKLRSDLSIEWQRSMDDRDASEEAFAVAELADGFVVAGFQETDHKDALVLRLDLDGNVLWQRTYAYRNGTFPSVQLDDAFNDIEALPEGGMVVAGYSEGLSETTRFWVARIDASGAILSQQVSTLVGDGEARSIATVDDDGDGVIDGFIATGYDARMLEERPGYSYGPTLMRFDANLGIVWRKEYDDIPTLFRSKGNSVRPFDENEDGVLDGYIVAGEGFTSGIHFGFDLTDAFVMRVDPQGEVVWQQIFSGEINDRDRGVVEEHVRAGELKETAYAVVPTGDGFVVAMTTNSLGGGMGCGTLLGQPALCPNILLTKLDMGGEVLWQRRYASQTADRAFDLAPTFTGGFVLAGQTDGVTGNPDAWILRMDADGLIADPERICPRGIGNELFPGLVSAPVMPSDVRTGSLGDFPDPDAIIEQISPVRAFDADDLTVTQQCFGEDTGFAPEDTPGSPVLSDRDADGIPDGEDNCPDKANPVQEDLDADGTGDACDPDIDGDFVLDLGDNCLMLANADQVDIDGDGFGDLCDDDDDGDGVPDEIDNCPTLSNPDQADSDQDGVGDVCQGGVPDADGDGVPDAADNCLNVANPNQADADGDDIGDACDDDSDNDGVPDVQDGCPNDPNKVAPGACGCGNPDTDTDVDGTADCNDNCPNDPNKTDPGQCGCGNAEGTCDPPPADLVTLVVHVVRPDGSDDGGSQVMVFDADAVVICAGLTDISGIFSCQNLAVGSTVSIEVISEFGFRFIKSLVIADQGGGQMSIEVQI